MYPLHFHYIFVAVYPLGYYLRHSTHLYRLFWHHLDPNYHRNPDKKCGHAIGQSFGEGTVLRYFGRNTFVLSEYFYPVGQARHDCVRAPEVHGGDGLQHGVRGHADQDQPHFQVRLNPGSIPILKSQD